MFVYFEENSTGYDDHEVDKVIVFINKTLEDLTKEFLESEAIKYFKYIRKGPYIQNRIYCRFLYREREVLSAETEGALEIARERFSEFYEIKDVVAFTPEELKREYLEMYNNAFGSFCRKHPDGVNSKFWGG